LTRSKTTGARARAAQSWERPPIVVAGEEWRDVVGWEGVYVVSSEGRVARKGCEPKKPTAAPTGYLVVSLNRPGEQKTALVHRLVLEAFSGPPADGDVYEAMHLNHNRADPRLENLTWGTSRQNSRDRVFADRNQRLVGVFEDVAEVRDAGDLPTYDLSIEGPWHNFVADGFVVHNSYNEMSARYTPIPDENYAPTVERCLMVSAKNKQAGTASGAGVLTHETALEWLEQLGTVYDHAERVYQRGLLIGVPKELARLPMPVGRFSRMRASANLRNWLAFMTLRSTVKGPDAQWEIRQFADALGEVIRDTFPRTYELFAES